MCAVLLTLNVLIIIKSPILCVHAGCYIDTSLITYEVPRLACAG